MGDWLGQAKVKTEDKGSRKWKGPSHIGESLKRDF